MGGGKRVIPFVTVVTDLGGAHPLVSGLKLVIVGTGVVVAMNTATRRLTMNVMKYLSSNPFFVVIIFQWFHKEVDKLFIASKALMRKAIKEGVDSSRIYDLGLPVREAFWIARGGKESETVKDDQNTSERRKKLRVQLGLNPNDKTVMIVVGGEGTGIESLGNAVIRCIGEELAGPSQVGHHNRFIVDWTHTNNDNYTE